MGHGKETPRQKMIGMMYLVLTALLALNVSAEILNAFILIDNSLKKTAQNITSKNDLIYTEFNKSYEENPGKVGEWKEKAERVKELTDDLFNKIQELKVKIVQTSEGETGNVDSILNKDDNNVPGQVMILEKNGEALKEMFVTTRTELLGFFDNEKYAGLAHSISMLLSTEDIKGQTGEMVPWEHANFEHLPLVGVITLMSKMQADIRNAEADMLTHFLSQIDASMFKFNKIEAIVTANSNYVLAGNPYDARVFIAASDSTQEPIIYLNGGTRLAIEDGKGVYSGATSTPGIVNWGGVIKLVNPATEDTMSFPFESTYQVGEPSLVISATKMNVFYIGVPNPVAISVPGVPDDKITASISSGTITRSGKEYVVDVRRPGTANISVSADLGNGPQSMGSKEFRVKQVPDPVPQVAGQTTSGRLGKSVLLAQPGVFAIMQNFDFDLKFDVVSFSVSANIRGFLQEAATSSARFTAEQKAIMQQVLPNQKVYIENIKARGPDGTVRSLPPLTFTLN